MSLSPLYVYCVWRVVACVSVNKLSCSLSNEQLTFTLGPSLYAGKPVAQNCTNPCTRTLYIRTYSLTVNKCCNISRYTHNTSLFKQNMKIPNKDVKVLVPIKKVSWSQYICYFTSGLWPRCAHPSF